MASNIKAYLKGTRTKHAVGTVTGFHAPITITNGATVTEEGGVDNFCLVEMAYVDGEPTVKYATALAKAENVFLTITPETVLESYGENICDFYNDKGEKATCAYLPAGFTFETSNVDAVESLTVGKFVVWDADSKKFKSKESLAPEDIKVFQVQSIETDERYNIDGLTLVELAVIR